MQEDKKRMEGEEIPVRVVDRRRFHSAPDGAIEAAPEADAAADRRPAYVQELEERLVQSEQRVQETLAAHRQRTEEFDQIRARLERDVATRVEEAKARIYAPILDVIDEMERAVEAAGDDLGPVSEGLRLIHRKLMATLSDAGVERLELEGQPFDPQLAEAIAVVPVDDADRHDRIVQVAQAGYRLGERVLRPARVQVGRHEAPERQQG